MTGINQDESSCHEEFAVGQPIRKWLGVCVGFACSQPDLLADRQLKIERG
jgi:hypothetical protein